MAIDAIYASVKREVAMSKSKKNPHPIALRLSKLRLERRMTQAALADRIGVTRSAIGQWEIGKTRPKFENIVDMARVLNVDPGYLVFGSAPGDRIAGDPTVQSMEKELAKLMRQIETLKATPAR
jgi:transcriptional regulator with XRE-family HTH domain